MFSCPPKEEGNAILWIGRQFRLQSTQRCPSYRDKGQESSYLDQGDSQNFLRKFVRFFVTLRCFYRVAIHKK